MEIKYLKHHQINKEKWNAAIAESQNGLVYALSWFLDIVSPDWEALVYRDYEIVMPLTRRQKFGIKYLYQPTFIQQLGIFSSEHTDEPTTAAFINEAQKYFRYIDIHLNYANPKLPSKGFILRNTQLIDISKSYKELYKSYKKNHRKNLKKLKDSELIIDTKGTSDTYAELALEMFNRKGVDEIKKKDIEDLKKVMDLCVEKGLGFFYFGRLGDGACAAAFFLKWKDRVIVYTALNEKGRKVGAMFGIIDKYLQQEAGKKQIFDFAGSNIQGVKYRNLGFGAYNDIYYRIRKNNLPPILKWLKN